MRGVLFLIKDGQAIITIIIRRCTIEYASFSYGWENPPGEPQQPWGVAGLVGAPEGEVGG